MVEEQVQVFVELEMMELGLVRDMDMVVVQVYIRVQELGRDMVVVLGRELEQDMVVVQVLDKELVE